MGKFKDFRIVLDESAAKTGDRHHVFAFGRLNPPTTGHGKLIDRVKEIASKVKGSHSVVLSGSQDSQKNPLSSAQKLKHARRFFPNTNLSVASRNEPTLFHHLRKLHSDGVTHLHFVAGSDRLPEYKTLIDRYNGKSGEFTFKKVTMHSAGERDPDAEGTEGMSASKMRAHAKAGNFSEFRKGIPAHVSDKHAREMYDDVRRGMNLREEEEMIFEDSVVGEIYIPTTVGVNMSLISRDKMPQIKSADLEEFRKYMETQGISSSVETVPTNKLKPSQSEFSEIKIKNLMSQAQAENLKKIIMISIDNYVLDGHHRWLANYNKNPKTPQKVLRFHARIAKIISAAKKFPKVSYKTIEENFEHLSEGVYDPAIFKAVFLAGGPGSGKDFVLGKIISGFGLVEVSSDPFLSHLMTKHKLDLKMPSHEAPQRDLVRGRAKNLEQEKKRLVIAGRLGIIVNGVADEVNKILYKKKELESLGYDTMMVFVNTSDEVSRQRNIERGQMGGRTVPENIRSEKWKGAQEASKHFAIMFGPDKFISVDNSEDLRYVAREVKASIERGFSQMSKKIRAFINTPPSRPEARNWIKSELEMKKMKRESIDELFEDSFLHNRGAAIVTHRNSYGGVVRHIARTSDTATPGHQPAARAPDRVKKEDWTADEPISANWTASSKRKEWTSAPTEAKADTFARDFDTTMALTTPSGTPAAKGYLSPRLGEADKVSSLPHKKNLKKILKEINRKKRKLISESTGGDLLILENTDDLL